MMFVVIAEHRDIGMIGATAIEDREEAHRIFANAQLLDERACALGSADGCRFTLAEVLSENALYDALVEWLPSRRRA